MYSYGYHFPLLTFVHTPDGRACYVLNADRYSITTSSHQSAAQAAWRGNSRGAGFVAVPRSALPGRKWFDPKLGYSWEDYPRLIDWRGDEHADSGYEDEAAPVPEHVNPLNGWTITRSVSRNLHWHAHRPGCAVFEYQGKRWLSGMDEGSYFVTELPEPVATVAAAFAALRPEGLPESAIRQGEWYFEPTTKRTRDIRAVSQRGVALESTPLQPAGLPRGNAHTVTECRVNGEVFARGCVRHEGRQHRMLKLGKTWHRVWRNRGGVSFNAQGRVD
jgi:hypothetical protein